MTAPKREKLFSGARKTARATAIIAPGTGRVRINNVPAEVMQPEVVRERILSPLELAGDYRNRVDINVEVKGGGFMGQAEAAAMAISRALVGWFRSGELKSRIRSFDKHLLAGDPRRSESKKFGGPGPRRRRQKSYR